MTKKILKIMDDRAVFKRRPILVGHLPENEKYGTQAGAEFEIESYAYADEMGDFDEHVKVALKGQTLNGFNTWFVFNRFAEIEFDGDVVYPQEEQTAIHILKITKDTILKRRPVQSSQLTAEEMFEAKAGLTFALHSYAYADTQGDFDDHIRFAIDSPEEYIRGLSQWYVFEQHAQVFLDDTVVYPLPEIEKKPPQAKQPTPAPAPTPTPTPAPAPKPAPTPPTFSGKRITVPGVGNVFTDQPIIAGGSFTWGEATHGGVRIPQSEEHADNIVALARQLQKFRDDIDRPFRITSWYRPNPWNQRAGGARRSTHLSGRGVDIVVAGFSGRQLAQRALPWWPGGLGIYPGNRKHILHLDVGPKRSWGI